MYSHWAEVFYPQGLPRDQWFRLYATQFNTVELNATFYRLPQVKTCQRWHDAAPEAFHYSVKVSRFITHIKRLHDCGDALENFLARVRHLGDRLGPLLYQLPPGLHRNDELLLTFLRLLPTELAHVFEFRHGSWFAEEVLSLLREHHVGFCVHDYDQLAPPLARTAPFAYVRLHGPTGRYAGSYTPEQLQGWAEKVSQLGEGASEVYVYFNNDIGGYAVHGARELAGLLASSQRPS